MEFYCFLSHTRWWYEILFSKEEEKPPWLLFHLQLLEESDKYCKNSIFRSRQKTRLWLLFHLHRIVLYRILLLFYQIHDGGMKFDFQKKKKNLWLLFHLQLLEESEEYCKNYILKSRRKTRLWLLFHLQRIVHLDFYCPFITYTMVVWNSIFKRRRKTLQVAVPFGTSGRKRTIL